MHKPLVVITPGDPGGIGTEVTVQALRGPALHEKARFLVIGQRESFDKLNLKTSLIELKDAIAKPALLHDGDLDDVFLIETPKNHPDFAKNKKPKSFSLAGYQSGWAIETAVKLVQKKIAQAYVTGPISKDHLN